MSGGPLIQFFEAIQSGDIRMAISALSYAVVILLFAFPLHELAHALAADRFGDDTPRRAGRITLNPFKQLDLLGSALFLLFGFGWASVPINSNNFRGNWRLKETLVALAGPAANLLLAGGFALLLRVAEAAFVASGAAGGEDSWLFIAMDVLNRAVLINLFLLFFNLVPVPPLDGSRILMAYASDGVRNVFASFGMYGWMIIIALGQLGIIRAMILPPTQALYRLLTGF